MEDALSSPHYDAIVVLGGGLNYDGSLLPVAKQRVAYAVELQEHEDVPLIMSGKWSLLLASSPLSTEAAAMKAYALSISQLETDDVLEEQQSMDTLGNAYFTKTAVLEPHKWRHTVVVTSEFHVPRAKYLFAKALGPKYTVEFVAVPSGLANEELAAKRTLEAKLINFYRELLNHTTDGDNQAIRQILNLFPGYSDHPKYTQAELLAMLPRPAPNPEMYGIQQGR